MTPEQEDQVRRALAAFGPTESMPPEVSARLDATLSGLVEERTTADQPDDQPADELAVRRRRRWRGTLVAAASVAVLGTGIGAVVNGIGMSGGDSMTTALDTADDEAGGRELAPEMDGGDAAGPESAPEVGVEALRDLRATDLRSDTLGRDVRRAARLLAGPSMEKGAAAPEPWMTRCALPDASAGDRLAAVLLDGERATLVLRAPVDGTHVAEIYSCDGLDLVALREVPVPGETR